MIGVKSPAPSTARQSLPACCSAMHGKTEAQGEEENGPGNTASNLGVDLGGSQLWDKHHISEGQLQGQAGLPASTWPPTVAALTTGSTAMSVLLLQHPHQSTGCSGPLQSKKGWHKYKAQGLWQWSALHGLSPYQPCPGPAKAIPLHGHLSFILSLLPHCPALVRITCTHCKTDFSPLCLPPSTLLMSTRM